MKYPIIVDYDGEVLLLKDENDISRIEPVDVESGNCRFWDAKGCRIDASVNGCQRFKLFGLSFLTSIDMSRARIVFTERQDSTPDIKGLSELLANGALIECDELKRMLADVCSKCDCLAPAIEVNKKGSLRSTSQSEQSESKC